MQQSLTLKPASGPICGTVIPCRPYPWPPRPWPYPRPYPFPGPKLPV
jgi:hypothetical protein